MNREFFAENGIHKERGQRAKWFNKLLLLARFVFAQQSHGG